MGLMDKNQVTPEVVQNIQKGHPKRLDSSKFGKISFKRKKELMCFRETYCKSLHGVAFRISTKQRPKPRVM
jgi:hypothetical protein